MEAFENIINKDFETVSVSLPGALAATATNYDKFFIARKPYEVVEVALIHGTVGSDGGSVLLNLERLQGTEALGSGDEILVDDYNLKGTINTVVSKKGSALQNTVLNPGDRIALKDTGTLTAVAGVCVTVYLRPLGKGHYA